MTRHIPPIPVPESEVARLELRILGCWHRFSTSLDHSASICEAMRELLRTRTLGEWGGDAQRAVVAGIVAALSAQVDLTSERGWAVYEIAASKHAHHHCIGGVRSLHELQQTLQTSACAPYELPTVVSLLQKATVVQRLKSSLIAAGEAALAGHDPAQLHLELQRQTDELAQAMYSVDSLEDCSLDAAGEEFFEMLEQGVTPCVESMLPSLNEATGGGYHVGMTVIGARPGHGKTRHMEQEALYSSERGRRVLIVSLEMPRHELYERLVMMESRLIEEKVKTEHLTRLTEYQRARLVAGARSLRSRPLAILDESRGPKTIDHILPRLNKALEKYRPDIVFFDHLKEVNLDKSTSRLNVAYAAAAKALSDWAKTNSVPLVLYHQLNRAIERETRLPVSSDLEECGDLEQLAYSVVLIWRELASRPQTAEDANERERLLTSHIKHGLCEKTRWVVAKARKGAPCVLSPWWIQQRAIWTEADPHTTIPAEWMAGQPRGTR